MIESQLNTIVQMMGQVHGLDISCYESSFLLRSLNKRMTATSCASLSSYEIALRHDSAEAASLNASLSIGYSEFFRNPLAFDLLEALILPGLVKAREGSGRMELRMWSAACAAGHEAYSLAMLFVELCSGVESKISCRIFATDRSEAEISLALKAEYPASAVQNVRQKHIGSILTGGRDIYRVSSEVRDLVSFARFDLLDDRSICPPESIFGDFDLILCCNLLFYYRPEVRRLILDKLQRGLSSDGYLMTGEAEREIVNQAGGWQEVVPPIPIFQRTSRGG